MSADRESHIGQTGFYTEACLESRVLVLAHEIKAGVESFRLRILESPFFKVDEVLEVTRTVDNHQGCWSLDFPKPLKH